MILYRRSIEFYALDIVTDPPEPAIALWKASFNDGETWANGELGDDGAWRWLVAGPDAADPPGAATVLLDDVTPLLLAEDSPEQIMVRAEEKILIV